MAHCGMKFTAAIVSQNHVAYLADRDYDRFDIYGGRFSTIVVALIVVAAYVIVPPRAFAR